jgi:hypothetical protein
MEEPLSPQTAVWQFEEALEQNQGERPRTGEEATTPACEVATPALEEPHTPCATPRVSRGVGGCDEVCAVCLSPVLDAAALLGGTSERLDKAPFTTACNHVFHRCCIVKCRASCRDLATALSCPLCRASVQPGLTPAVISARILQPLGLGHPQFNRDLVRRCRLAREAVAARFVAVQRTAVTVQS